MTTKRARTGDVLEVLAPQGLIYLHYLGRHQEYGDAIAVCPTTYGERPPIGPKLFHESYVTFYPVAASVRQNLSSVVGHLPSPGLPMRFRRPGARFGRKVETWIIEDDSQATVKKTLSDEECKLPIAVIWNHEYLVQRVSESWRSEVELS